MIWELFIWSGTLTFNPQYVIMHESYWLDSLPPHILLFSLTASHTVLNSIHQQAQCCRSSHPCNQTQCLKTCTSILLHQHAPYSPTHWLWMNLYYCSSTFVAALFIHAVFFRRFEGFSNLNLSFEICYIIKIAHTIIQYNYNEIGYKHGEK